MTDYLDDLDELLARVEWLKRVVEAAQRVLDEIPPPPCVEPGSAWDQLRAALGAEEGTTDAE